MEHREPSQRSGRDLLLVMGVLTLAFVLGAAGAGIADSGPTRRREAIAEQHLIAMAVPPSAAVSWPVDDGDRPSGDPACPLGQLPGSDEDTNILAPRDDDPGEYLGKMVAMLRQRAVATATTTDPYLASLDPGFYAARNAGADARDGGISRASYDQQC